MKHIAVSKKEIGGDLEFWIYIVTFSAIYSYFVTSQLSVVEET